MSDKELNIVALLIICFTLWVLAFMNGLEHKDALKAMQATCNTVNPGDSR